MASFTFDRQIKLSEEGFDRLCEILSEPVKPDGIKPFHETDRKEVEELLEKYWFKNRKNKTE